MSSPARKYTDLLLQMIEEDVVSEEFVITCCVKYMSEDDVKDMMKTNELLENGHDQ